MFWLWFWFKRYQMAKNGETIEPATFRQYIGALCILMFLSLTLVITFALCLFFIFFPYTGSFDDFYPSGTVNCYISRASDTYGYTLTLITEEDGAILTTPLTKARYQEMDYLCKNEPSTLYCLNTYHTGKGSTFISTYDDQTTDEAWQDYKAATQQSSIHKNTAGIVALIILTLPFLIFCIGLLMKIIKEIRSHRSAKAIEASIAERKSEEFASTTEEGTSGLIPSATGSIGLPPPASAFDSTSEVSETLSATPVPVAADTASDPLLQDDLSDEIDAFDPGNASWHK